MSVVKKELINELSIVPDRIDISLREAHNNTFGIPMLFIFTSCLLVINSPFSIQLVRRFLWE